MPQNELITLFEMRVGRIAIVTEDGNIVTMDQTGGNTIPLTQDGGQTDGVGELVAYSLPVWSPDGQRVAFARQTFRRSSMRTTIEVRPRAVTIERGPDSIVIEESEEGMRTETPGEGTVVEEAPERVIIQRGTNASFVSSSALYVADAAGRRPMREVFFSRQEHPLFFDWSPSGDQLALLTRGEQGRVRLQLVEPRDGAQPRALFEGRFAAWHWNPRAPSLLARLDSISGRSALALLNPADGSLTRLSQRDQPPAFLAPAFSPDGQFLLITRREGDEQALILADMRGEARRTLLRFDASARISFAWSPAGAKLAYVIQQPGESGGPLRVMDVNSGERTLLVNRSVVAFFWAPDGARIAVFSEAEADEIPPDFKGFDFTPPMPAPTYLLEVVDPATRASRKLFYFAPTNAFQQLAAEFDRYSRAVTPWAPDGRKLVFTLTYGSIAQARDFVLETEASGSIAPRVIGNGSLAFWSPR
ncbi:MAG: hypothetical protein NZL91_04825 [Thermoflexales bacterium]|nr:hypothetical protein [Thermoflexales bacterium]MCS7323764.1 hypothetical protein [Thermoflexales bacterium]MDW8054214.1 hypothetical protein [Anaerolineae bacterium]MDW8292266.1 hypothetical protein [Anaerolineae bacterium]